MREQSGGSAGSGGRRTESPEDGSKRPREHGELAGLGITMALSIALFALAGNWLDGRLGTQPLFVLLGAFLGFGGSFYSMYARLVLRRGEEESSPDD